MVCSRETVCESCSQILSCQVPISDRNAFFDFVPFGHHLPLIILSASKKWQAVFLVNIRSTENFSLMIPRFSQLHQIVPAEGKTQKYPHVLFPFYVYTQPAPGKANTQGKQSGFNTLLCPGSKPLCLRWSS